MENIGLVLEGGGLRGVYTTAILDYFLKKELHFNYTIGVSAGAIYSVSYASEQKERNLNVIMKYLNDSRYMGYKNLLKDRNFVNTDFAYKKMAYELEPFDFETFIKSNREFKVGVFNCVEGKTDFFSKKDYKDMDSLLDILMATASLPFFSKEKIIENDIYLDGGIKSPIPIKESINDGNSKNVIILTEDISYEKEPLKLQKFIKFYYRKYPKVAEALIERHEVYNNTLDYIKELEKTGEVFVFRPSKIVEVARLERNLNKIKNLYELGIMDAEKNYENLKKWLEL